MVRYISWRQKEKYLMFSLICWIFKKDIKLERALFQKRKRTNKRGRRDEVGKHKVWYMHVWKCHNNIHYFGQLIHTNKKTTH
jgi:hypothetical protein